MKNSNLGGKERSVSILLELLTTCFVGLLGEGYISRHDGSDDALHNALGVYANDDQEESIFSDLFVRWK